MNEPQRLSEPRVRGLAYRVEQWEAAPIEELNRAMVAQMYNIRSHLTLLESLLEVLFRRMAVVTAEKLPPNSTGLSPIDSSGPPNKVTHTSN